MTSTLSAPKSANRPSDDVQYQVSIENTIMKDVRPLASTPEPSLMCVVQIKGGGQDIYAADGYGQGMLRRYYTDTTSVSGWSRQDISLPGHGFISMTAGTQTDGTPRVFVMTADADIQSGKPGPATIYELPLTADGTPGMPKSVTTAQILGGVGTMRFSPLGPSLFWGDYADVMQCPIVKFARGAALDKVGALHFDAHPVSLLSDSSFEILPDGTGASTWPNVVLITEWASGLTMYRGVQEDGGLMVSLTALPTAPSDSNLGTFSVGSFKDGRRGIFALSNDGRNFYSLEGHSDPSRPGDVVWDQSWETLSMGIPASPSFLAVDVVPTKDGGMGMYAHGTYSFDVHRTFLAQRGPKPTDQWSQLDMVLDFISHAHAVFQDDEGDFGFAVSDPQGYLHLGLRDDKEDWRIDQIDVDTLGDKNVQQVNIYRVGVMVNDASSAPILGKSVTITPDDEVVIFVNGKAMYASNDEPLTVQTDNTGSVWLMMDIDDSLSVPTLALTSTDGIFDGKTVTVDSEGPAQHFLTQGMTGNTLEQAKDDQGNALLPAGSPYDDIAKNLNKLGDAIAHIYEPQEYISERLTVKAKHGVRVVSDIHELLALRPKSAGHWCMTLKDGKVSFEDLTPEQAATRRLETLSAAAVAHGLKTDALSQGLPEGERPNWFWDDIADAFESIGDTIIEGATVVIDGIKATVNFVIDGITHIVDALLDAASAVLDVVKAVLDFAGAVFGKVVGWLIRAIGWLLGLPDMNAIKNKLKDRVVSAIKTLPQSVGDPRNAVAPIRADLQTWKTTLASLIESFESTPPGSESYTAAGDGGQSLASVFSMFSSTSSISSQATWVIEKLFDALPKLASLPDAPDFGISATVKDALSKVSAVESNVDTFMTDMLGSGLESWMESLTSLDNANIDPMLETLKRHATDLLTDADGVVYDLGEIAHALWANPTAITDWLDQEIYIPFFSAFYEGMVGDKLSLLDFACLAAALPYSVIGPNDAALTGANDDDKDGMMYTIVCFMVIRAIFVAMSAAFQEPASQPEAGFLGETADYLVNFFNLGISAMIVAYAAKYDKARWYAPAVADLVVCVFGLIIQWAKAQAGEEAKKYGTIIEDCIGIFGGILGFVLNLPHSVDNLEAYGYVALEVVSDGAHLAVDCAKEPLSPQARVGYTALQGVIGATRAFLFYHDNKEG